MQQVESVFGQNDNNESVPITYADNAEQYSENDITQMNPISENIAEQNLSPQPTESASSENNASLQQLPETRTVKVECVPLFGPVNNNLELEELLINPTKDQIVIEEVEDMVITRIRGQILQPLKSVDDGLIKRENDVISGSIPYKTKVSLRF